MPPLSDLLQSIISFLQAAGSLVWQLFVRIFLRGIFYFLFVAPFKALFFGAEKKRDPQPPSPTSESEPRSPAP